jgi:hypothetical protein
MKDTFKFFTAIFGFIALSVMITFSFASCDNGSLQSNDPEYTPVQGLDIVPECFQKTKWVTTWTLNGQTDNVYLYFHDSSVTFISFNKSITIPLNEWDYGNNFGAFYSEIGWNNYITYSEFEAYNDDHVLLQMCALFLEEYFTEENERHIKIHHITFNNGDAYYGIFFENACSPVK